MDLKYQTHKVLSNIEISEGIFKLHVAGTFEVKPGQFYMLSVEGGEVLLPRPISIHDIDEEGIYFLYAVKGRGTKLLKELQQEDEICLLGPLGNGFEVDKIRGKAAIVAGGIGTAPMTYLAKCLKNSQVDLYFGFRDEIYGTEKTNCNIENIFIATETGSKGSKGFITDIFNPEKYDVVLSCGPEAMMKKVVEKCREHRVPIYVSMEKYMACGIGACLVCTCSTIYGNKRTCVEGPVFSGEELILDA